MFHILNQESIESQFIVASGKGHGIREECPQCKYYKRIVIPKKIVILSMNSLTKQQLSPNLS